MSTKTYVLELLEQNRGMSVSGAEIAKKLDVSRSAIWKAIRELVKEGYQIDAATNRGYSLKEDDDRLSVPGMLPFLANREQGEHIFIYEQLESTNITAKEMAIAGAEHGTVVIADSQTGGKGRHGRSFYSPVGCGIYLSCILYPDRLGFDLPTAVTAYAAIAVCEAIEAVSGKKPGIKWVNDVFLDRKKICGILSEAVADLESGVISWIVTGIGINFCLPPQGLPEALQKIVGTVFGADRPPVTRNRLAAEVINRLTNSLHMHRPEDIFLIYKERLMMLGETIQVNGWNEHYEAKAVDIDEVGRLIVQKKGGDQYALSSGEISIKID